MPPRIRQIPTPLIGIDPRTVMPRQPGESTYDYRFRRSVTLYGQTPYERRIWLAQQRGIGRSAARGHAARGGITETQSRTQRTLEQTGLTPSVLYRNTLRGWLTDHGYTPDATGMNWTALMKLGPRIRWMYNAAGSDQGRSNLNGITSCPQDGRITASGISTTTWSPTGNISTKHPVICIGQNS
jgi:hypothetical protein